LKAERIPGWFTPVECQKLYNLIMITDGSILEIGHFLGRSTACICEAIHDSQKTRAFTTYDLGFLSADDFKHFYDKVHQRDVQVPSLFEEVYAQNVTSTELATKNLRTVGLEKYASLVSGNFIELDHHLYDFIFCDAMHEPNEIEFNLPHVVKRSAQHCIWAFHDMSDHNIELVLQLSNSRFIERAHSLGVFIYLGANS
jgi:predicted O-methyltransferase YrrM